MHQNEIIYVNKQFDTGTSVAPEARAVISKCYDGGYDVAIASASTTVSYLQKCASQLS